MTLYVCFPEFLDDFGVEIDHHGKWKEIQKDGLDDGVDEAGVVAPVGNAVSEIPKYIFGDTRLSMKQ